MLPLAIHIERYLKEKKVLKENVSPTKRVL